MLADMFAPENADRTGLLLMGLSDILQGGSGSNALNMGMLMKQQEREAADEKARKAEEDWRKQEALNLTSGFLSGYGNSAQPSFSLPPTSPEQDIGNATMMALGKPGAIESGFDFSPYSVGGAASRSDSFTGLQPDMQAALIPFLQAADSELGPGALKITSAYRSPELQAQLWQNAVKKYGSPEAARKWVAPPGHSQHNKGTAIDFAGPDGGLLRDANSREAQWIKANAGKYGLAVPMDWEPWQVELAGARGGAQQGNYSGLSPERAAAIIHHPDVSPAIKSAVLAQFQPQEPPSRTAMQQNAEWLMSQGYSPDEAIRMARGGGGSQFNRFKVVGNQLYDLGTEGGPTVVGSSQHTPGFSVTTSDGTTVTHGWQGNTPPGQNPSTTGTSRDPGKLSSELSKKDAAALEEINTAGRTATDIESLATQLETVAPQVGYTGPGGQAYGFIDDVVGVLPGDSGARGAFKSLAMEAQLTFTEKTKGAITDREMGMFKAAVPNLGQTQEGNAAIAQVMKAGAARTQTRAAFFQNWARKHGSLEGAQEVWSEYMRDNPLITQTENGIAANPEGNWQSYLNRQPAMSYTPESILQMDQASIGQVPIERLTGPQLDALERRMQELGL